MITKYKGESIFYTDQGTGPCIVLLHGFTETSKIWTRFARELSRSFRVVTIDLPGFGKSECVSDVHTMDLFADVVRFVLRKLGIKKCMMAGHSMGGFVTLAFAKKYTPMLKGLALFHSHPYADSDEIKRNRDRTVRVLRESHVNFITQFIPSLFAPASVPRFSKEIEGLMKEAAKSSPESLIASTEGMKLRADSSEFLKGTDLPVLFIVGMQDARAPLDRIGEMILLPKKSDSLVLKEIGHMGYLEAYPETIHAIRCFAQKVL